MYNCTLAMALTKPRGVPLWYIKGAKTQADINKLAAEWKRMPVEKRVAMKKQMTPKPKKAAARKGARGAKPRKTMKHRKGGAMMAAALASGIEPHRAARNLGLAALASIPARRALWDPAHRESPNLRLVQAPVRDEFDRGGYEVYYKGPGTEELLHRYPYDIVSAIRTTGSLLKPFQSQALKRDAERQLEREISEQPQRTAAARQAALRDLGAGILRGVNHGASSTAERAANNPTATAGAIASLAALGVTQKAVKAIRRKQRATEQKQRATESAAITAQSYYRMRSAQNKANTHRNIERHAQAAKTLPFNAVGSANALPRHLNAIRSGVSPPKVNVRAEPNASWTPAQAASMSFGLPRWSPGFGGSGMSSMSSEPSMSSESYPLGFPAPSLAPSPVGPIRYGRALPKASPKKHWGIEPKRSPKKSAAEMRWSSKPPSPKAGTWSTGASKKQYANPELAKIKSSYTAVVPALAIQRSPTLDTSWEKSENQMYNSNKAAYRQQITRDAHAMPIYPHSNSSPSLPEHLSFSRVARHQGAADSAAALAMDAGLHLSPVQLSHGHVPVPDHNYLYERLISTIKATGVAAGLSLLYYVIKIARTPTNAEQAAKKAVEKAKVTEKVFSVQDLIDYAMSKWSLTGLSGFIVAVSALLGAIYAYRRIRRSQGPNSKAKSSTPSASLAKSSPASSFASLSVKELRDLLKGMGISVTKNGKPLRKAELVKLLEANS